MDNKYNKHLQNKIGFLDSSFVNYDAIGLDSYLLNSRRNDLMRKEDYIEPYTNRAEVARFEKTIQKMMKKHYHTLNALGND